MSDGTKADDIALALEEAIVSGEIPPGSTLRQEHLSDQFQVSRTPVREALRRLAALGLVTFEPNRGVRVRMLSLDDSQESVLRAQKLDHGDAIRIDAVNGRLIVRHRDSSRRGGRRARGRARGRPSGPRRRRC